MYPRRLLFVLIFVASCVPLAAARDLALVANKSNTVNAMTVPDLARFCKGEVNRWPDGKPVTFVMRAPSVPEMRIVLEKIYGMSESEVTGLIVTANHGRGNHPAIIIATSDEDLINRVASLPGAIGLVDVYSINSSVAVIKIAGKGPFEPGYLLHGN